VITTRSARKSTDTLALLRRHLERTPTLKAQSHRVSLQAEQVDLTVLTSIYDVSKALLASLPRLDAVILNAGMMGLDTVLWFRAVRDCLLAFVEATTFPLYMTGPVGLLTKPQLPPSSKLSAAAEPPLGQVFCANVFGHYLLVHHLAPLLSPSQPRHPGRVIWISSIDASDFCGPEDVQALNSPTAYHSSKRLTDLLAITSTLSSTQHALASYFPPTPPANSAPLRRTRSSTKDASSSFFVHRPRQYTVHPGIVGTDIVPLHHILSLLKLAALYVARWLGSPWHTITGYKAACAPVWLALAPQATLDGIEEREGVGKWGSGTDVWGGERIIRTEVEGWGFGGRVGGEAAFKGHWRKKGAVELTTEEREAFEKLGATVWEHMEQLRIEWEVRLGMV
jgi:3-keto steroid reductase